MSDLWSQLRTSHSFQTIDEIIQQPQTWKNTLRAGDVRALPSAVLGMDALVLTGSGSSLYAAECAAPSLQTHLRIPVTAVSGGDLLAIPADVLPHAEHTLMISLARSGDSPESTAAIDAVRRIRAAVVHLAITCNQNGLLARHKLDHPPIVLADETNDRSLVMTSSFTNLVLAATAAGRAPDANILADAAEGIITNSGSQLCSLPPCERAVYLGTGPHLPAARESALKMLEMTGGRVASIAESYLGLRHGPMSFLTKATLIVCFLSSNPAVRPYEVDVIEEMRAKKLGQSLVIFGADIPFTGVEAIQCSSLTALGDFNAPVLDVVVGQILALSQCIQQGFNPDSPSSSGVITRVVNSFRIHTGAGQS